MPDKKLTDVTDNKVGKMTDTEIKKALEKLLELVLVEGCLQRAKTISNALDLINRLQAELNQYAQEQHDLMVEKDKLFDIAEKLQAENERLRNAYKQCAWERDIFAEDMKEEIKKDCSYLMLDIKTIKAEAYKECIEKIKALFPSDNEPYQYWEIHEGADNLLKELVGENGYRTFNENSCS